MEHIGFFKQNNNCDLMEFQKTECIIYESSEYIRKKQLTTWNEYLEVEFGIA